MSAQTISTPEPIYHPTRLALLDSARIPLHVSFINDGNRRWAKQQKLNRESGHRKGADNLMDIVKAAKEIGIKYITFYLFSTENWNRPFFEVKALMRLIKNYLIEEREAMIENGVKLHSIGDCSKLPKYVIQELDKSKEATSNCEDINVIMALNYGSRDEIKRAVNRLLDDYDQKKINKDAITEKLIAHYLDTNAFPDPDLLIRTSGEMRLSNYLLWQSSYTELFITDVLWPDFTPNHLLEAVIDYQQRERRSGT